MKLHTTQITPIRSQRGLSLIELMISITIGLLILAALSSLFISQSRARAELDKANRMIDNGRYAVELLAGNLRLAGFYDSYSPTGTPAALPDPCDPAILTDPAQNLDALRLHVQGYHAATSTSTIASPPCSLTYATGSTLTVKPGSDILVVRRVSTTSFAQDAAHIMPPPAPQVPAPNDGTVYLQVSSCQYNATEYLISRNPAALTLGQRNIGAGTNNCVSSGGVNTIVAPYADLWPLVVEVYFVSPDNNPGDGIPTLKRRELRASGGNPVFVTTPLVEGIEYMQVEYGIDDPALDSDGIGGAGLDGVPDAYDSCAACTPEQWSNVVSVKLHLVARNTDETKGYSDTGVYSLGAAGTVGPLHDSYKRHAYTQDIRLVNPSGRREAP